MDSYNISYKDPSTGNTCSQVATIPALACQDNGVCRHTFEVSSSFCHPSTNISVTVTAASMFGVGEESEPLTISIYDYYTVYDSEHARVHGHALLHVTTIVIAAALQTMTNAED